MLNITNMKKLNIAEILKKCPKGMELNCTIWENVTFEKVVDNKIVIRRNDKPCFDNTDVLNKYGCVTDYLDEKCIIFPKGKTTWEGFQIPFKDGDVLVHTQNQRFIMSIYHKKITDLIIKTHCILWDKDEGLSVNKQICCYADSVRLATEEEKQKLFDAIKSNGYIWNDETKTLNKLVKPNFKVGDRIRNKTDKYLAERTIATYVEGIGYFTTINDWVRIKDQDNWELVPVEKPLYKVGNKITNGDNTITIKEITLNYYVDEHNRNWSISKQDEWELIPDKFDISTLKPFDKVLVRDGNDETWVNAFFGFRDPVTYKTCTFVTGNENWCQCIPYEGNEYLLGTTDNCDDFYKNW